MVDAIDGALVCNVDWTTHSETVSKFLEVELPTLVDKPIARSLNDLEAIATAAQKSDAPLFGGSSFPYHPLIREIPSGVPERTVYCAGAGFGHTFYCRTHVTAVARSPAASDWKWVAPVPNPGTSVAAEFANGTYGPPSVRSERIVHADGRER